MSKCLTDKFQNLVEIIAALRHPETGCPWDLKQTHQSLKPYLIEEAYETLEAIDQDQSQLPDELGDVLLQVMLHSQIGEDADQFSIADVIDCLSKKLVERHPHIFSDTTVSGADEVAKNWNDIKNKGKGSKGLLGDLSTSLPALMRADKIGQKVANVGFDWENVSGVKDKVVEELQEFLEAFDENSDGPEVLEELGDLLFCFAQLIRKLGSSPEVVLQNANNKFTKRFEMMEQLSKKPLQELSTDQLETLWQEVKNK